MGKGVSRYDEVLNYLEIFYIKNGKMPTIKQAQYDLSMG